MSANGLEAIVARSESIYRDYALGENGEELSLAKDGRTTPSGSRPGDEKAR